jgi:hypothetical protein
MKLILINSIFIFLSFFSFSQTNGFLRGNIADGDAGGGLYGAKVRIKELPSIGAVSDFDGNYSINLPAGTYQVEITSSAFETLLFSKVQINSTKTTVLDAVMKPSLKDLMTVNVVGKAKTDSDVSILLERKNASLVTDGISAQAIKKTGDSDLSGAIKRVTGVTVQDGKYVFVRGLGDRYTQTTLNGVLIPGLDPDVNSLQLDIFPTSVLENLAIYKTSSPELYGDFTGGLVNIVTKKFPTQKTTQIGAGISFTPSMHFNDEYILYDQNKMDVFGLGGASRKLPFHPRTKISDESLVDPELEKITRSFDQQLGVKSKTALPNGSFSFNHGNQVNLKKEAVLGYNFLFNYSNETQFFKDYESNDYLKNTEADKTELFNISSRKGNLGKNSVLWSALGSTSYKKGNNTFQLVLLNIQNGESSAAERYNQDFNQNQSTLYENVLTYTSRTLSNVMISGNHVWKNTKISWINSISRSKVDDPDFRETRISITDGDTSLSTGNGAGIDRFWRNLIELNESFKLDFSTNINENNDFVYGVSGTFKSRDFSINSFKHRRNNLTDVSIDPDWFLAEENYWSADIDRDSYRNGTYTIGNFQPANTFSASQQIIGAYLGMKQTLISKLKLNYGLRVEKNNMFYTGQNNEGSIKYVNEKTMDELNLLPSININYVISEKMNVRLGGSKSVARPSFRERSIAQIYDPITKRTFNGNINLNQTDIYNMDARYELFLSAKELIAISGFYKQFHGHIEMVSFAAAPNNITPRNAGMAHLVGAEMEIRKTLTKKDEFKHLSRFFLNLNLSLVASYVDLKSVYVDEAGQTEYELRTSNLRDGETLKNTRPMAGQSPYAINAGLNYEVLESETVISLNYNVQGEQLTVISSGRVPDVYTDPFHSLNFNAMRAIGKNKKSKVNIGVNNILNDKIALVYKSYNAENQIYSVFKPGIQFNFRYSFTF